jgi:predicted metal-binding membrane protein
VRAAPAASRRGNPVTGWAVATYAILFALATFAWLVSDLRMSGMDAGPGTALGTFVFFLVTWVVMMAAMMFPSVAPVVATYVGIQRGRRRQAMASQRGATACFVAGYLLVWSSAGALAYGCVRAAEALSGDALTWDRGGRWLAGSVLLTAALYEVTPLKRRCLTRCRGPVAFIVSSWRDGRSGALRMGALHGAWCLGCCWALMAALFALGIMSLSWMAVIAVLIAVEKVLPWRRAAVGLVVAVLSVLAVGVTVAPHHVPGLVVPGSSMSMH